MRLGVNIDHVATIRELRHTVFPNVMEAALIAVAHGADSITVHLREDRRHIQESDVEQLRQFLPVPLNLEMAATDAMLAYAEKIRPLHACLVPEKRAEVTTESGLDMFAEPQRISDAVERLSRAGIIVSLFVDPEPAQIDAAKACGAPVIELHTGAYAEADSVAEECLLLDKIRSAAQYAFSQGLIVHAGHGLHYTNVQAIAAIPEIIELNIGHSIVARSIFVGLADAVTEMKTAMLRARV